MRASPPSIEHGNCHWTGTKAPSPAERNTVITSGRRYRRAAPRRVHRRELRRPSLVSVAGEHHRSPEIAGKPSGPRKKPCACFLKRAALSLKWLGGTGMSGLNSYLNRFLSSLISKQSCKLFFYQTIAPNKLILFAMALFWKDLPNGIGFTI